MPPVYGPAALAVICRTPRPVFLTETGFVLAVDESRGKALVMAGLLEAAVPAQPEPEARMQKLDAVARWSRMWR